MSDAVNRTARGSALPTALAILIAVTLFASLVPGAAHAQKERPGGILRGLIHTIAPGSPEDLESRAMRTRDVSEALDLYGTLESRYGSRPEGIRASIWIGLYSYGKGDPEGALVHFERARKETRNPVLRARAAFWCDQARLLSGREPIADELDPGGGGFWGTLRGLTRVDRSIQAGRRVQAEQELLSIEGDARRAGLLGPQIARWGDVLRTPGTGRTNWDLLSPILNATAELPERLMIDVPIRPSPAPEVESESWSVQFGAFLDPDNADALSKSLESKGIKTRTEQSEEDGRRWYRVRLDQELSRADADSAGRRMQREQGIECEPVRVR